MKKQDNKRLQLGPVAKKIILLLSAGICLSLTKRPDQYFRLLKSIKKEWNRINDESLHKAIRNLYHFELIDYRESGDGVVNIILTANGRKKSLEYNLDKMEIKKPLKWDGLWRMVIFDIPENKKLARNALSFKLRKLGFYPLQKSVYVHPFDCKNEIDFINGIFEVGEHVRFIIAKDIDIALRLQKYFKLT